MTIWTFTLTYLWLLFWFSSSFLKNTKTWTFIGYSRPYKNWSEEHSDIKLDVLFISIKSNHNIFRFLLNLEMHQPNCILQKRWQTISKNWFSVQVLAVQSWKSIGLCNSDKVSEYNSTDSTRKFDLTYSELYCYFVIASVVDLAVGSVNVIACMCYCHKYRKTGTF